MGKPSKVVPKFEKSLTQWTDYNYILFVIITFGLFPKPSVFVTQTHFGPCRTVAPKHQEISNSWPSGTIRGWKMAYRLALKLLQRANSVLYQGKICHLEMPGTERHIRRSGTNRKICRLPTKKYTRKTLTADCCKRVLLRFHLDFEISDFWVSFLVNLVPANTGQ